MADTSLLRAAAVGIPTILLMVSTLFGGSYLLVVLVGAPAYLAFPLAVRILGWALVLAGLGLGAWVFRYRSPATMMMSTYLTFEKLFRGVPLAERSGRTEPLVVAGPQKYVRNPLYSGVVVMVFGWALAGGYTFVLVAAFAILAWFRFVIIPFEEKELLALFGEDYVRYTQEVPMLIPFTNRGRHKQ